MLRAWIGLLLFIAACGASANASSGSGAGGGTGTAASGEVGATTGSASGSGGGSITDSTSAATGSSGTGSGGSGMLLCYVSCKQSADCAIMGTTLYDANHYECQNNLCQYKGCLDDKDCTAAFQSPNYVCAKGNQSNVDVCYPKCNTPHDCALASTLYDDDNFSCLDGHCEWAGCNTDQECIDGLGAPNYFCDHTTSPIPSCQLQCSMGADCVTNTSELYGADNFACVGNVCKWLGCNSDAECIQASMNDASVCR